VEIKYTSSQTQTSNEKKEQKISSFTIFVIPGKNAVCRGEDWGELAWVFRLMGEI
jgi:hypothetical protein